MISNWNVTALGHRINCGRSQSIHSGASTWHRRQAIRSESMSTPTVLSRRTRSRRAFLTQTLIAAGATGAGLSVVGADRALADDESPDTLTQGDAALLRFAAAAEILESDFWIQYNELGGIQDPEVSGGFGNFLYTAKIAVLDEDMAQYVHDNTDDEVTHHQFLNAYLMAHGEAPANLDPFRTLMGSIATGVNTALIGHRLTNLTQLTVDTSWW